jgi:hypothetical protein
MPLSKLKIKSMNANAVRTSNHSICIILASAFQRHPWLLPDLSVKYSNVTFVTIDNEMAVSDTLILPVADKYVVAALHSNDELHATFQCSPNCSVETPCTVSQNHDGPTVLIAPLLASIARSRRNPLRVHFASCELGKDKDALELAIRNAGLATVTTAYRGSIGWDNPQRL